MMLSKRMEKDLNEHLNKELYSAYLYLSMASYFRTNNYNGMGSWMEAQAKEELGHGMKFYGYLFDRGAAVSLKGLAAPSSSWKSLQHAFQDALKHEQQITAGIHALVASAIKEADYATHQFLEWFVKEQVEEERSVEEILQKFKLIGGAPAGLYMIDRELGARE